jgi:hypothetical protein
MFFPPRFPYLLLVVVSIPLLPSCAKQEDPPSAVGAVSPIPVPQVPAPSLSAAGRAAQKADLKCKEPSGCPAYVGLLAVAEARGAGQCTAVAVGTNRLLTNAHCIPKDLQLPGLSCENRVWFHYLVNGQQQTVACNRVLEVIGGKGQIDQPDYALLELEEGLSSHLNISPQALLSGQNLSLWKSNPVGGMRAVKAELVKDECLVTQQTFLSPDSDPTGPTAPLKNCEVREGNSGSPLIDSQGNLRALVFGFVPSSRMAESIPQEYFVLPSKLEVISFATNLTCLRTQAIDGSKQLDCGRDRQNLLLQREKAPKLSLLEISLTAHIRREAYFSPALGDYRWRLSDQSILEPARNLELQAQCRNWDSRPRAFQRPVVEFQWILNEFAEPITASFRTVAWGPSEILEDLLSCSSQN